MAPTPAAYMAWSSPINPVGSSPLTVDQIWAGLHRKVRHAEEFVPAAIKSTDVISESTDEHGREVVTRDVVFKEGDRKAREVCTFYPKMKVEFLQSDGSRVLNTVSDGAGGQLYMTYQFEWMMDKDTPVETQEEKIKGWKKMSQTAVDSSINAIRKMVEDGRIKA